MATWAFNDIEGPFHWYGRTPYFQFIVHLMP